MSGDSTFNEELTLRCAAAGARADRPGADRVADPGADDEHPGTGWAPRWEGRVLTSFERKAQEAGRTPRDLTYRRLP